MISNWLDIILLIILLVGFLLGLIKGFVRQIVGIAAVVVGLILAAVYYQYFSRLLFRAFVSEQWSHLVAFLIIFLAVLAVGWLIGFLLAKLMVGPLKFFDRLLGGALGICKGVLICGVIVMAMLIFPVNKQALMRSSVAPYCYWLTKAMIQIIPKELKEKFKETYKEIIESTRQHGEKV
jgi:membrane protein required for colicin V production